MPIVAHRTQRCRILCLVAVLELALSAATVWAAEPPAVRHPNLLLNREEIEQVKAKIRREPWAAKLLERAKALAHDNRHTEREPRDAAVVYALTGEKRYAERVRQALLGQVRSELPKYESLDIQAEPEFGAYGPAGQWAWAYDLTYDTFTDDERRQVEHLMRWAASTIVKGCRVRPTTMGLVFEKHWKVALLGYCLGDRELIEWGLHDPGSFGPALGGVYTVLDTNIRDELFWSESPHYGMGTVLHGFLAVAEAAQHYDGTDLYHHVSKKSGGSIKGMLDGYLRIAYPLEHTGIHNGSLRLITYGDGSTGYTPTGQQTDTYLINPVPGGPKAPVSLNGEFEIAYKRYREPGYAWIASLNPERDGYIAGTRSVWGFAALTHGEALPENPQPPPAPSGIYASQGLAVLRADTSPAFWTSQSLAAALRLGAAVGHGHNDYFHLLLHGKGRLLYPTVQLIQYEPNYLGWTREGIACNTLLVDHQSPHPGPVTTRRDEAPGVQFFAATGSAFAGVTQTRALLVTPQYVADVFRAADERGRRRSFDWVLHGLGRLFPGNPAAYRPTHALTPFYWWVENERGRTTGATWQADWVQHNAGVIPGAQGFSKDWFAQTAGVRMTMLGHEGTEIHHGDGPITDGPPYALLNGHPEGSVPLVIARRQDSATTFAAIHEPFERRPALRQLRRLEETEHAIGIAIDGEGFSDRVLVGYSPDREQTLRAAGEAFTFRDHAYLRVADGKVTVRGPLTGLRLHLSESAGKIELTVNGKAEAERRDGEFLVFGRAAEAAPSTRTAGVEEVPAERTAAVHYSFLPEEVHLRGGGERETTIHLRCVGATPPAGMNGRLRFLPPTGVTVEPAAVDVSRMSEGDEKDIQLHLRAERGLPSGLYPVRIEPADGAIAAAGELTVSVGVVVTTDRLRPLLAQSVIRAPGYTMRLDHRSGTSFYLLDADGHRRHGHVGGDTASGSGFFAVSRPGSRDFPADAHGNWAFNYRLPCRFVFEAKNNGTDALILTSGGQASQVRLRYTFHEDRIVATLVPPTDARVEYEMWLGDFDVLGAPWLNPSGTQRKGKETAVLSEGVFFPHPRHRQGMLLTFPDKRPICSRGDSVHFSIRAREDVVLRFVEEKDVPEALKREAPANTTRPVGRKTDKKNSQ
jgi:hypothetical protein